MAHIRLSLILPAALALSIAAVPAPAADVDFAHDVVPLLRQHCAKCHTGTEKQGGLSMNTRETLIAGGDSGTLVVPGKSGKSELIARIAAEDESIRMPPEGPALKPEQIALLKRWIDAGLPWDDGFAFQQPAYEPPLQPRRPELPPVAEGRDNPVDRIVDAYFAAHNIKRPQPAGDAEFLRRVSLDLVGLLPTPQRLDAFLADLRPDKRVRLIRELLADDVAYAEHWLSFWNDLLRNDYTGTGFITGGRKQITPWLYRSLVDNKPYDQFVRELIAPTPDSEGFVLGIRWRGDVNASQTPDVQFAQNVSQAFLGINMKCASCHNSFVDRWTLDEAYGLAAIYATQPLTIHRCDKTLDRVAQASWIFPELGQIDPSAPQPERLKQLAGLMTHPENGRFTRTVVNRLWHRLMGRGIVHPVDAMHTQPWSADLLDHLAVDLADHDYDLKRTIELICTSAVYQSETPPIDQPADPGEYVFRGPVARRMTAEQFVDAVWQVTGAAPAAPDAAVIRAKLEPGAAADNELKGSWIWSAADAINAPAGQTVTFRKTVKLDHAPVRAVAVITCDNSYTLYVNGRQVKSDDNWETAELLPLEAHLKAGNNQILVVAHNGGNAPNPAALFFEARLRHADGAEQTIAADASWQWTKSTPDAKGRFKEPPKDWQPAAVVEGAGLWAGRVGNQLAALLTQAAAGEPRMVRAALMKNDFLMRSLGRPNRDQIVSMRPSELTTLEAIDLANGQILADAIAAGAKRRLDDRPSSPQELATWLCRFALSRPPTADEQRLLVETLSETPAAQTVEDALWAVFMLPEFQLVR